MRDNQKRVLLWLVLLAIASVMVLLTLQEVDGCTSGKSLLHALVPCT